MSFKGDLSVHEYVEMEVEHFHFFDCVWQLDILVPSSSPSTMRQTKVTFSFILLSAANSCEPFFSASKGYSTIKMGMITLLIFGGRI